MTLQTCRWSQLMELFWHALPADQPRSKTSVVDLGLLGERRWSKMATHEVDRRRHLEATSRTFHAYRWMFTNCSVFIKPSLIFVPFSVIFQYTPWITVVSTALCYIVLLRSKQHWPSHHHRPFGLAHWKLILDHVGVPSRFRGIIP